MEKIHPKDYYKVGTLYRVNDHFGDDYIFILECNEKNLVYLEFFRNHYGAESVKLIKEAPVGANLVFKPVEKT